MGNPTQTLASSLLLACRLAQEGCFNFYFVLHFSSGFYRSFVCSMSAWMCVRVCVCKWHKPPQIPILCSFSGLCFCLCLENIELCENWHRRITLFSLLWSVVWAKVVGYFFSLLLSLRVFLSYSSPFQFYIYHSKEFLFI